MSIYSTRFYGAVYTGSGAVTTLYTVPAGKVAVLRDVEATSVGTTVTLYVLVLGGVVLREWSSTSAGQSFPWTGRQVLNAGEALNAYAPTSQQWSLLVSGYLLDSP